VFTEPLSGVGNVALKDPADAVINCEIPPTAITVAPSLKSKLVATVADVLLHVIDVTYIRLEATAAFIATSEVVAVAVPQLWKKLPSPAPNAFT
jgi:hypothetical protein